MASYISVGFYVIGSFATSTIIVGIEWHFILQVSGKASAAFQLLSFSLAMTRAASTQPYPARLACIEARWARDFQALKSLDLHHPHSGRAKVLRSSGNRERPACSVPHSDEQSWLCRRRLGMQTKPKCTKGSNNNQSNASQPRQRPQNNTTQAGPTKQTCRASP